MDLPETIEYSKIDYDNFCIHFDEYRMKVEDGLYFHQIVLLGLYMHELSTLCKYALTPFIHLYFMKLAF